MTMEKGASNQPTSPRSVNEITTHFISLANEWGEEFSSISRSQRKVDKLEAKRSKLYDELMSHGEEGITALVKLVSHECEFVRMWAAADTLNHTPKSAEVLSELSRSKNDELAWLADTTLKIWEEGGFPPTAQ